MIGGAGVAHRTICVPRAISPFVPSPSFTKKMILKNRQIILKSNPPEGAMPTMHRDFSLVESELDTEHIQLQEGDLLLETLYISVDAYSGFFFNGQMEERTRRG